MGGEIIASAQFLLQELVLLEGERPGKIVGWWRKVLPPNEIGKKGVTVGGQIVQQAPETNEMMDAGSVAEGRLLFAQAAEPAEEMGITAELRELANLGESSAEIGKESVRGRSISLHRGGPQGEGERLDMACEDLFEAGPGWVHEI
jgi:hypothetical protein